MSESGSTKNLAHPRNWLAWVGIVVFRVLVLLPWRWQFALGRILGRVFFYMVRHRRLVVTVNLRLCFPEKSAREIDRLAKAHYEALGIALFETCMAWWMPDRRLPAYEIIGGENLEAARAKGKGVILLTAHFTTLELCGRFFSHQFPLGCLYRDPDNEVIAHHMQARRAAKMTVAIQMNDLRGLLRGLKQGHIIWYAPDQGKKTKFSTLIPFFGVPAQTNTATSRLAEMTGAQVVPYFGWRKPDGSYRLVLLPALDAFPTADVNADALRINQLIEEYIREAPEQYFWVHRRFKRRGKGHPNVYK